MVPAVSTFDANGDLDRGAFIASLDVHMAQRMDGVLVAGSSGESAPLDGSDRRQLPAWARERVPRDKWLLAGIGSERTRLTISRAQDAKEAPRADGSVSALTRGPI